MSITELDKRINMLRNCARDWGAYAVRGDNEEQLKAQRETREAERALREYIEIAERRVAHARAEVEAMPLALEV